MKILDDLIGYAFLLLLIVVGVPLLIILAIIIAPYAIISAFFDLKKRKKELKKALKINNGKIFFLYREYHKFNFSSYFEKNHAEVNCIQVQNCNYDDVLLHYLTKNHASKSYPKLVKIERETILKKEHYNAFKHYIRRNNDIDSFFKLIDSSIKNLEKLPYK